ncbi:hypothetical protein AMELA_G00143480 [Ameiurus melas]|uniref:Uncharacterized protein n=1 Tax=Ameiurus melas TaxID=219545 RepID=A0A7J6AKT3_AMEME|nr:hypothetical protein AMELA_G00143480 [Ameiurus melas]
MFVSLLSSELTSLATLRPDSALFSLCCLYNWLDPLNISKSPDRKCGTLWKPVVLVKRILELPSPHRLRRSDPKVS